MTTIGNCAVEFHTSLTLCLHTPCWAVALLDVVHADRLATTITGDGCARFVLQPYREGRASTQRLCRPGSGRKMHCRLMRPCFACYNCSTTYEPCLALASLNMMNQSSLIMVQWCPLDASRLFAWIPALTVTPLETIYERNLGHYDLVFYFIVIPVHGWDDLSLWIKVYSCPLTTFSMQGHSLSLCPHWCYCGLDKVFCISWTWMWTWHCSLIPLSSM